MSNEYIKRKVAMKDMQPCFICHTPATTVLYNGSMKDFLYTCDIHLHDNPSFVVPLYSQEYNNTLAELQRIKQSLKIEASKGSGSWDTWVNKVFAKKKEAETDKEDKEDKEDKAQDTEQPPVNYQLQYDNTVDKLTSLQQQNKRYKLSDTMFQHRIQGKHQQELAIARRKKEEANYSNTSPEELTTNFSFPSAPTNDLK